MARIIAPAGRFNLEHLSAQIAQHHCAVGAGHDAGQVEHPHPGQQLVYILPGQAYLLRK
jgi:hypothetical protein